jgi:hypothetical protein
MNWLASLSWVQTCCLIMGALILTATIAIALDIWRAQRRYKRHFNLNPMFRVGGHLK